MDRRRASRWTGSSFNSHTIAVDTNGTTAVNVIDANGAPCAITIKAVRVIALDTTAGNITVQQAANTVCTVAKGTTAGVVTGASSLANTDLRCERCLHRQIFQRRQCDRTYHIHDRLAYARAIHHRAHTERLSAAHDKHRGYKALHRDWGNTGRGYARCRLRRSSADSLAR